PSANNLPSRLTMNLPGILTPPTSVQSVTIDSWVSSLPLSSSFTRCSDFTSRCEVLSKYRVTSRRPLYETVTPITGLSPNLLSPINASAKTLSLSGYRLETHSACNSSRCSANCSLVISRTLPAWLIQPCSPLIMTVIEFSSSMRDLSGNCRDQAPLK